jgi:hypothetical protein
MRASAYSRHRPRRLGPLSRDSGGLCIEVSLLLVEEGSASNSKCVLLLFLALCVIRTHRHPASARNVPLGDYGLVTVGPLSTRPFSLSSHPSSFHWTTSPSRGPSLATADADKNLGDIARIFEPWDAEALEQFFILLCKPHCYCFSLLFSCYVLLYSHCHLHISFDLTV